MSSAKIFGRDNEKRRINLLLRSNESEFLAVTGRRRVGKTYLVDQTLGEHYCFTMIGLQHGTMEQQLEIFASQLSRFSQQRKPNKYVSWFEAFEALRNYLETLPKDKKQVIFIDELPWAATPKSKMLTYLGYLWNAYLSKEKHFVLVICGSATSWIVDKVLANRGGLHNRVTKRIHLYPFTLKETKQYLMGRGLRLGDNDIARIYMTLGGIPFYLKEIERGESFPLAIDRLCFRPDGALRNEYRDLYHSLFSNAEAHIEVVTALADKRAGLSRKEILQAVPTLSEGTFQKVVSELEVSNFIRKDIPYGRKKRGTLYRLIDEFSIFFHKFMEMNPTYSPGFFTGIASSPGFKSWAGFAFEVLCHRHVSEIKQALGIAGVYSEVSTLRIPPADGWDGCQIDLLIDRRDDTINLCEIKFRNGAFSIDKEYKKRLAYKRDCFINSTKTTKQVFITMISNQPLVENEYFREIVDATVLLEDLFK
jgi:AAA+ ATPase superfamily predicted ATPase